MKGSITFVLSAVIRETNSSNELTVVQMLLVTVR
jgi:hypothetical protein